MKILQSCGAAALSALLVVTGLTLAAAPQPAAATLDWGIGGSFVSSITPVSRTGGIGSAAAGAVVQRCPVDVADLSWGVKETFRSYISGSIANGEWTVADGATYQTPAFGWPNGQGAFDPETEEGLIAFTGSIRFTGHGGVLDTTLADPQLRFLGSGDAVLLLNVRGTTQQGTPIDQTEVEFATLDLSGGALEVGDDGTVTIAAAPAMLTAAGAAAFGTYPEGEPLDPITASFALPADCLTSSATSEAATAQPDDSPTSSTGPDLGWILWLVLALVVVLLIAGLVVLLARRRPTV